jgi:ectoine hydroxylase-related dioxygenase (phytanoyl-CoA dioxygenase family)
MHVDGVSSPHLDPAELRTFSLLVGIPLSDVTSPGGGALHYLPGGHLRMSRWFAAEWSIGITNQVPPAINAETGTPFLGSIGDLLLMHHLIPHAVGANNTGTPRVMAYLRLSHTGHASRRLDALRDPWLDYPPLAR